MDNIARQSGFHVEAVFASKMLAIVLLERDRAAAGRSKRRSPMRAMR
jgi:hypothetical protein